MIKLLYYTTEDKLQGKEVCINVFTVRAAINFNALTIGSDFRIFFTSVYIRGSQTVGRLEGARFVCMGDIFILNEIWAQDKIYILIGTLLGLTISLIT
jgi:hypothetical protein